MASSEVAVRAPMTLPSAVQDMGVEIHERDGVRAVFFPQELRGRVNVLLPVAEVAQADPHFSPSIRLVELEKERHTYSQGNNRNALSKQGLEILANTAGIFDTQARRIPKGDLDDGEIGYEATIKIRRSDGTIDTITRTKIVDREVEQAKIADEVTGWMTRNNKSQEQGKAEFKKRWLKERGDIHAKAESKAVLRAIRAALQIPHVFTDAEMKRPFLVIGYSFTPDWEDPVTRSILVSHGLSAGETLYGPAPGLPPAPEPMPAVVVGGPEDEAEKPYEGDEPPPPEPDEPDPEPEPEPPSEPNPDDDIPFGDDPEPEPEPVQQPLTSGEDVDPEAVEHAAQFTVAFGRHSGKSVAQIAEDDPSYLTWLAASAQSDLVKQQVRIFCEATRPDLLG